ncbi:hypothetical protein Tco_0176008, partial [Tanacetum coccineum]
FLVFYSNPSRPVSTRKQLASDALWCCFHTELSKVEPKNFKMAVKIQEEVRRAVLSFLEIDWLAGHQRNNEARKYNLQRLNTSPCLDVVLKSFGCDHSSKTTDLTSIKFLCTVITKVLLLCAVTMSSTLALNTLTYGTISSELSTC